MKSLTIAACGMMLLAICWTPTVWTDDDNDRAEQTIKKSELPQVIQAALKGVDVTEIEVSEVDGKTVYEIEIKEDDVEIDLVLNKNGKLLKVEVEDDDDADRGKDDYDEKGDRDKKDDDDKDE